MEAEEETTTLWEDLAAVEGTTTMLQGEMEEERLTAASRGRRLRSKWSFASFASLALNATEIDHLRALIDDGAPPRARLLQAPCLPAGVPPPQHPAPRQR